MTYCDTLCPGERKSPSCKIERYQRKETMVMQGYTLSSSPATVQERNAPGASISIEFGHAYSLLNELSSLLGALFLVHVCCSSQDTDANHSTNDATNDSTIV